MALKTAHKVGLGIGATIAIIALVLIITAGVVVVYHNFHVSTSSGGMQPDSTNTNDALSAQVRHADYKTTVSPTEDQISISNYKTTNQITDINDYIKSHRGLVGVVTITAQHSNGVVFASFSEHNIRTIQGIGCFSTLFYPVGTAPVTNTTGVCPINLRGSAGFNGFNVIALINHTGNVPLILNASDKPDNSSVGNKCGCGAHGTGTRASAKDGLVLTQSANQGGPSQGTVANSGGLYNTWTITSGTFSYTQTTGTTIAGAMLINQTKDIGSLSGGPPVAYAETAFTPIALASGDTLTATWTVSAS